MYGESFTSEAPSFAPAAEFESFQNPACRPSEWGKISFLALFGRPTFINQQPANFGGYIFWPQERH